ncbi:MarR family transcriptional regulator [Mucilaginibacter limnophilus]|uniref:MarR family transcriptional regulator n=1 Tax=Mucilaginibacter limnophilus TaxID=1932778 RepID=A0A3S2VK36_9SPHI|nr:MarR family transcriptional regulator [Mucilaginibacter limnophilus]
MKNSSLKLIMNLAKVQAVVSRKFDRLSVHGIGFSDFLILHLLHHAPGEQLRRIELAEKIGLTPSGVTRLVMPLEKSGLVTRQANERDARVSYAKITATGKRIYNEAMKTADSIADSIIPITYIEKDRPIAELFQMLGGDID